MQKPSDRSIRMLLENFLQSPSHCTVRTFNVIAFFAAVFVTFVGLRGLGYEPWYNRVSVLMFRPWEFPIASHRLLFAGVARIFRLAIPGLEPIRYFWLSQSVALLWTFSMMGIWVRNIIGEELRGTSYLLLAVMFLPTFSYYNYYDVAMLGFHALCLTLLLKTKYVWYLPVFAIGLTNHENLLLLAPVCSLVLWLRHRRRLAAVMAVTQVAIYLVYRGAMEHFLPADTAFAWKLEWNIHPLAHYPKSMLVRCAAALVLPFVGAALGFRTSPKFLQIAALGLFSGLVMVTTLFGQLNEARQFDAFFVVAVPTILSLIRSQAAAGALTDAQSSESRQAISTTATNR